MKTLYVPKTLIIKCAVYRGSYSADRLIKDGHDVMCVDNFDTGSKANVATELFNLLIHKTPF